MAAFWVTLLIMIPTSVLMAWVSYHAIEAPGNYLRRLVDSDGSAHDYYAEAASPRALAAAKS